MFEVAKRVGLVVVVFLLVAMAPVPIPARAADFIQSQATAARVDPADGSVWVFWFDQNTYNRGSSYLSHFNANGQLLRTFEIPRNGFKQYYLVLIPGAPRLYFTDPNSPSSSYTTVLYTDLTTGQTANVPVAGDISKCDTGTYLSVPMVFNPVLKKIYVPCHWPYSVARDSDENSYAIAIDITNNRITGTFPYIPLGYNPVNSRLYVAKTHIYTGTSVYSSLAFDLITLVASTETVAGDPLFQNYGVGPGIRSFHINEKTGQVFAVRSFCYAKCSLPELWVFDKDNNKLSSGFGAPVEYIQVFNEATNQYYGPHLQYVNRDNIAIDASNPAADFHTVQLAGFYWTPLAVDQARNLVYAVDNRGNTSSTAADRGLGIIVMDGKNFDITRFFTVRPPDQLYLDATAKLNGPPAGFKGWYFPETRHTLSGKFLDYWLSHGGLAIFGYPLTEEFEDYNPEDGKVYRVQYFERHRFEYHPELAGTQFEVLLGLLGRSFSSQTGLPVSGYYTSGQTEPVPGGVKFLQTGHTLTGKFYEYWQQNGALMQFGLPATEPFQEISPTDGKTYTVQYFERNRFEYHPEFAGTRYEVELGLLGSQLLQVRGWPV